MPCAQQAMYRHPCRLCQKPMQSGRGAPAHAPDLEASCISIVFFVRDGWPARSEQYDGTPAVPVKSQCKVVAGRPRMLQIWRQSALCICFDRDVVCVCVCGGGGGGGGGIVSGSPPVGWGRGCLLIRSSDNPLPRAGEGGFLTAVIQIVKPPTPRGLVGFWIWLGGIGGNNLTRLETPMGWGDFLCQRKMPQLRCTS